MTLRAGARAMAVGFAAFPVLCPERSSAEVVDVCKLSQQLAALFDKIGVIPSSHPQLRLYPNRGNRHPSESTAFLKFSKSGRAPGHVRTLVSHEASEYKEWSASGSVEVGPGPGEQGLTLTLTPSWGAHEGYGSLARWETGGAGHQTFGAQSERGSAARLESEIGYSLRAAQVPGLITPYAALSLGGDERAWRIGTRWALAREAALGVEASRDANDDATTLMVRAGLRW